MFVEKNLRPLLSKEEEKLLLDAEGKWPRFPRILVELADNHPLSVVGPVGWTHIVDLPGAGLRLPGKVRERLVPVEGR